MVQVDSAIEQRGVPATLASCMYYSTYHSTTADAARTKLKLV